MKAAMKDLRRRRAKFSSVFSINTEYWTQSKSSLTTLYKLIQFDGIAYYVLYSRTTEQVSYTGKIEKQREGDKIWQKKDTRLNRNALNAVVVL